MLPHRVYVGTIGEGVWRSLDGGVTFTRAADGMFVECHVRAIALHPVDARVLLLGSEQGLFRSNDGADNWHAVSPSLAGKQIWSVLIHPSQPERIVVGACPAEVFHSADGGKTWDRARANMRPDCPRIMHTRVTTLEADPADARVLWAGVEIDGLFRSDDLGRTWEPIGTGVSSRDIHDLCFVKAGGTTAMLAATNNDLNRSTDAGRTWQPLGIKDQLPWPYCRTLAQPIGRPETVLLGNGNGPPGSEGCVARSDDGGLSWRVLPLPGTAGTRANSTIWNYAVHAADANLIYASSVSGQLYRSRDQGASWEKCPREFGEIRALAWGP
jgi:photosystem II stability/assembly factor-like uncharacterized protein